MVRRKTKRSVRRVAAIGVVGASVALALSACGGYSSTTSSGVPIINLYGGASAAGFDKIIAACNKQANGEYEIVGNLLPSDADGQREQFVRRLAAHDASLDLLGMDVTWTAEFAEAGWIRPLSTAQATEATANTLEPPIKTAEWKDRLYGIPKHTNVQILWYRKSLVPKVPTTWDEMMDMAKKLKSEGKPYVIGFTGAQYEGYVVGFNTLLSSFGGTMVNEDSTKVTIDDRTTQALDLLHRFATSGVASKSLSNAQEPEVFAELQNGQAAFAINWPYVLSAMRTAGESDAKVKAIADDLGYAPYPKVEEGKPARVTLGGMNYAISTYSKHPKQAFDAAMCLRTPEHQVQTALEAGDPPVAVSAFSDPKFQEAYPQYQIMLDELKTAVSRPISPLYQNISTIVSSTLSPPSSIRPEQTTKDLRDAIQQALDGKGILP